LSDDLAAAWKVAENWKREADENGQRIEELKAGAAELEKALRFMCDQYVVPDMLKDDGVSFVCESRECGGCDRAGEDSEGCEEYRQAEEEHKRLAIVREALANAENAR